MPNLDRDYYLDKAGLAQFVNEFETNIVAEEFSTSATYNLGDYCIYDNLLYLCTTAVTTAGSWTGSTNWLQVLIGDELSEKTEIHTITLAQWETLTPEQKASGDYVISDATLSPLSASLMPYDNTTSGLTADDVQEAIDELAQGSASSMAQLTDVKLTSPQNGQELVYDNTLTSPYKWENRTTRVELTQVQYNALVTAGTVLPNVDYYITDAPSMNGTSADLSYDGTTTSTYAKISTLENNTYTKTEVDSLLAGLKTITTGTITSNSTDGWGVSTVCCNKVLNIVSICFEANKSSALASGWNTMGTLPSGFRPSSDIYVSFIDAQNDFGTHGKINSSGQIQVYKTSSMSTRERGSATYIVSS